MKNNTSQGKACCTPQRSSSNAKPRDNLTITRGNQTFKLCDIPGGPALVGTDRPVIPLDEESPCRTQNIEQFRMMQTTVTNELFARNNQPFQDNASEAIHRFIPTTISRA